ncbi:MAG: LamG domain-containing protein, partial [Candidatus Omnitrophica bacterium]|nr:LamG domain-containing protein [Candidatus Omnitrophota bacterium]
MYRSFLIVALLAGLGGQAFSQNTTDWTQPYEADAGAVDLYHFYDGALGGEQEIVDYAAPYLWGWTHNGTGAAPLHVPSMPGFGECIQLDGIDDRGEFPPDGGGAHNVYSNDLSVEAWINPVNLSGIHRIVHMHGTVSFYTDGTNLVMWLFGNDGGNMWFPATTNNPLTAGEWSHVAGTYHYNGDGTAVAKFYVNGNLEGTQNLSSGALPLGNARNTNWQMLG